MLSRCLLPRWGMAKPQPAPNRLTLDAEFGGDARQRGTCRV